MRKYRIIKMMTEDKSIQEHRIFKRKIVIGSFAVMAVIELISLLVIGWSPSFLKGLAVGTMTSALNFELHALSCEMVVNQKGEARIVLIVSYFARLLIVGVAYYFCAKYDIIYCGFGCIFGLLTEKASIYIVAVILPALCGRKTKREQIIREEE